MPPTFATSKISRNCQTVIPKRVRRVLGLVEGSVIRYERDGDAMRITRLDVGGAEPDCEFPTVDRCD